MTCKDCVHYEKCKPLRLDFADSVNPNHICELFKNKADFVEAVHCKDCVCFSYYREPIKGCNGKCEITQLLIRDDNFFCRDGVRKIAQRKEGEDKAVKQTVVFDFDGVIHSYLRGWEGADVILDPPVPGIKQAIEEIRGAGYEVAVVSTRCATPKGMKAVERYLSDNEITVDKISKEKPPAIVYIDDRAICFDGKSGELLDKIKTFKPWYQKE